MSYKNKVLGRGAPLQIRDLRSRSNLRSLAYKQACSLVSLDYVASGSTGRAEPERSSEHKKAQPNPQGIDLGFLVDQLGLEPRTDRLWAGSSNQLSYWSK